MKPTTTLYQLLRAAFPAGYLTTPGTRTMGGHQALRGATGATVWCWPHGGEILGPDDPRFDVARKEGLILPDLSDASTWGAVLRLLGGRVGLTDYQQGLLWVPKAGLVTDRARGSSGKVTAGWTVRTLTRSATFSLPGVIDPVEGLLRAVALTNCACSVGAKRACPTHGDAMSRPWR